VGLDNVRFGGIVVTREESAVVSCEKAQSTAEYALMVFWVILAIMAVLKLLQDGLAFFCQYVVSLVGLPVP
jgi:hypothetical protein